MFSSLFHFLFPRRCPVCDEPVTPFGSLVCTSCTSIFPVLHEPLCMKCGRKIEDPETSCCHECLRHPPAFNRGFSLWEYGGPVRKSVEKFKYGGRREYADYYADMLFSHFSFLFSSLQIVAIIPVPLHKKRLQTRGYNQAALIASALSEKSGIPMVTDYLIRTKNTRPQNSLNPRMRKSNLEDAFSLNPSSFSGESLKTVLLIDDIYTTGSTASTCARLLKRGGTQNVFVLCLTSVSSGF